MFKSKFIYIILITSLFLFIVFLVIDPLLLKEDDDKTYVKKDDLMKKNDSDSAQPIRSIKVNQKNIPSKYTSDEFQAGMNILIYGHPNMLEVKKVLKRLRSLGINSVAINFPFYQSSWQANKVTTSSEETPTINELEKVIAEAHDLGISVMIKPIMDEQVFLSDNMWRGQIKPTDPDAWFDSYENLLLTYAKLAESTNVKLLNIGTELNSMQYQYQDKWSELIEKIRNVYHGELLYSFNWDTVKEIPSIPFVDSLDHIGIDAYFPLEVPADATVEMLEQDWKSKMNQIEETLWDKSIIVTEAGILPVNGAYRNPSAWSLPNQAHNPKVQVNYYEATYNAWKPKIHGIYWWDVTIGQDPNEISFSPLYSPTEKVIKKHFLKGYHKE